VIWLVPAALLLVAVVPVLLAARRVAAEAAELHRAVASFAALREPVLELRDEVRAATTRVPELRLRTRPALPPAP
jgi:hypothetical protein